MRIWLLLVVGFAVFGCTDDAAAPIVPDATVPDDTSLVTDEGGAADIAEVEDVVTDLGGAADVADVAVPDDPGPQDVAELADTTDTGVDAGDVDEAPWQVIGGVIYHDGAPAQIRGVNWFGMETADHAPHGLWSGRPVAEFVGQVGELGFNALRLPVTPGSIRPGFDTAGWAQSAGYATGREALEAVIGEARAVGLFVLLDFHSCDDAHGKDQVGAPDGCEGASITQWHDDLRALAQLGVEYDNVLGIDLFNEPWGLTWGEWAGLVGPAASVVLDENPDLLIFVQGVANASDNGGYSAFWGGNMVEASAGGLDVPGNRLVFSPHVYGPSVAEMDYFSAGDYPLNLPKIWQTHFAHLHSAGLAVITGEFGSRYDDAQVSGSVAWQDAWITFMVQTGQTDFFYWALNANTGDITGILQDDWLTPDPDIMAALGPLLP